MDDATLLRYSRHILLPQIGIEGQQRLLDARVLVVGVGGLGSPAALYLAAAGVGTLVLADDDAVDLTNLQRQIVHRQETLGLPKPVSAQRTLHGINPACTVEALSLRLEGEALWREVAAASVVLDCSDNFSTRHAVNRACVALKKPLVSGAAVRFDGQLAVFDARVDDSPCYHCLFPEQAQTEETRCAVMGVFAPVTGVIGTLQAAQALKLVIGCGDPANGQLLLFDGLSCCWRSVQVPRDPGCAVCGAAGAR